MVSTTSPNVENYYNGKGIVKIKMPGDIASVDVGNVPEFEFEASIERLDHYTSRAGIRSKDRSIVLEKGGTLRIVFDEWTPRNLALALLGDVDQSDPSNVSIDILAQNAIVCSVEFQGTNDVGPKWNFNFPRVEFVPSASLSLIQEDDWGQIEIEGEVLYDEQSGSFGTATSDFTAAS
jgi:hypothetical protein